MDSMVIKGLDPDTNYQFTVRAVNPHGSSPRSQPSDTIHTTREYCGPSAIQADRQIDVPGLLRLPQEDPLDRVSVAPCRRAAWSGAVLSLSCGGFPSPLEVRGAQQGQAVSMRRRSSDLFLHYPWGVGGLFSSMSAEQTTYQDDAKPSPHPLLIF